LFPTLVRSGPLALSRAHDPVLLRAGERLGRPVAPGIFSPSPDPGANALGRSLDRPWLVATDRAGRSLARRGAI